MCEQIQSDHQVNIYIYLLDKEQKAPYIPTFIGREGFLYVHVYLHKRQVELKMTKIDKDLRVFHEQVFFQWVATFLQENRGIYKGLNQALQEIDREYDRRRQIKEQEETSFTEPDEFTIRTRVLVDFFKWFFVVFVLLFTLKGFRSGNQYEIVEYYDGLSRLTGPVKLTVGLVFFIISTYWLYLVIPYEELAVIYVGLAFTAYPIMIILGLLIKIPEDIHTISKLQKKNRHLSLGQIAFLGNQRTPTEYLMEFTFYEAVFNQSLSLLISSYESKNGEVVNLSIQKGKFDFQKKSVDTTLFLLEAYDEPLKLSTYLNQVYKLSGRFKAYRKDVLVKPLVAAGYVSKWGWIFNIFLLTKKGKSVKSKIKQKISRQNKLINLGLNQPENLAKILPQLDKYCLLIDDFESRLTEFHNMIAEFNLIELAMQRPIGILFDYRLSLRAFNAQLKEAYFYGLPWSWHDNDANEGY